VGGLSFRAGEERKQVSGARVASIQDFIIRNVVQLSSRKRTGEAGGGLRESLCARRITASNLILGLRAFTALPSRGKSVRRPRRQGSESVCFRGRTTKEEEGIEGRPLEKRAERGDGLQITATHVWNRRKVNAVSQRLERQIIKRNDCGCDGVRPSH